MLTMTGAANTNSLRQVIQRNINTPLSRVGQRAFEAFLALPNVEAWNPEKFRVFEVSTVFDVGLPFALLGDNDTVAVHKKDIVNRLLDNDEIACSRWSEILAGALFSNWNGGVSFLRERDRPTSDIEVRWGDGPILSVEVTRADTQRTNKAVEVAIGHFAGAIQAGDFNWHLICFFADASNSDDMNAVFEAAMNMKAGESTQVDGRWAIRAVPMNRGADVVGGNTVELFAPVWWPAHQPVYFSTSSQQSPADCPVVYIRSLYPETSYKNAVMRKADSGQRRKDSPYLIALDASQLPGAHDRIKDDLDGYFPNWNHVSAVMVFDTVFLTGIRQKSWRVSLYRNPDATMLLPNELLDLTGNNRQAIDFEMASK